MTLFIDLIDEYNNACERMDEDEIKSAENALYQFGAQTEKEGDDIYWFMPGDAMYQSGHWRDDRAKSRLAGTLHGEYQRLWVELGDLLAEEKALYDARDPKLPQDEELIAVLWRMDTIIARLMLLEALL